MQGTRSSARLWRDGGNAWGARLISLEQSFAKDVDSFLSRAEDTSDAFQIFASFGRSKNVNLLKEGCLPDVRLGRGRFGAEPAFPSGEVSLSLPSLASLSLRRNLEEVSIFGSRRLSKLLQPKKIRPRKCGPP